MNLTEITKRALKPPKLRVVALLIGVIGITGFAIFLFVPRNHTQVRNLSGQTLANVVLEVRDSADDSEWKTSKRVASLQPGRVLSIAHRHNDTRAVVSYSVGGREVSIDNGEYVDLWTGETWTLDIQADGQLKTGHFYDGAVIGQ